LEGRMPLYVSPVCDTGGKKEVLKNV
jgi:hypothetical protein